MGNKVQATNRHSEHRSAECIDIQTSEKFKRTRRVGIQKEDIGEGRLEGKVQNIAVESTIRRCGLSQVA